MVVELGPGLRVGVEKGIEYRLREHIEVFLKEGLIFVFVFDGKEESNIIVGDSFL